MARTTPILEELFAEHGQGLINFLRKKFCSKEDAEDIAQNAFIRIRKICESDEAVNPKAYLYQTASNLLIDMKRREKVHENYIHQFYGGANELSHGSKYNQLCPSRIHEAAEELRRVEKTIAGLKAPCRQAFLMHRFKGMSYSDISKVMGVSVSSVEKYILETLKHAKAEIYK